MTDVHAAVAVGSEGASPEDVKKFRGEKLNATMREEKEELTKQQRYEQARKAEKKKFAEDLRYWSKHQKYTEAQQLLLRASVYIERT